MINVEIAKPEPRTAAALAARRRGTQAALDRVADAITRLRREKTPVTVAGVARRATVSRTFLYANPDAKAVIAAAATQETQQHKASAGRHNEQHEASWRERALNAEDALKAATAEILAQRSRIGEHLGRIRDLEARWTREEIQRIRTENTTLTQRVQQLAADNRTLDERLKAARSNLRFQDRRIADLEAQLAAPEHIATGQ
jgi:chromosome segregation ATPase